MKVTKLILALLFLCSPLMAQNVVSVSVTNYKTRQPVSGASIYNSKGELLGKTDNQGKVKITAADFPLFIRKRGYATEYAYSVEELRLIRLHLMGGEIRTVVVHGGTTDSLLTLRDKNLPFFHEQDTIIYYHFKYSLDVISENWKESADGYIEVHFKGVGAPIFSFNPYRYAYFTQFNYQGDPHDRLLPPSKIMPVVLMFGTDWMSGYGYPLWNKLTDSYLEENKRHWILDNDENNNNRVFSSYGLDESNRLMEKVVFGKQGKLKKISLYTPEYIHSIGALNIFSNFSKTNGVNSFLTVYTYTDNDSNRLLDSIHHLSTFYEKDKIYYKMDFTAHISPTIPEESCKIPVFYLAYNHFYPEGNGWGVWLLLNKKNYNINRDHWLKSEDKEYEGYKKEYIKLKEQEQADSIEEAQKKSDKD